MHYVQELGLVALGSRFKALSDRLYALADDSYRKQGVAIQGRWFPLLRILHDQGALTIGEVAAQIGQSHSAISQLATRLERDSFLQVQADPADRRCRRLCLSESGRTQIRQAKPIWRAITRALEELTDAAGIDLLTTLGSFERVLDAGLAERIDALCQQSAAAELSIVPFQSELREHFYRLNADWLEKYFYIEEIDHRVLSNPEQSILEPGGAIYFAKLGDLVVGTCALLVEAPGVLELSKMGVDEDYQGLGIGRALIDAAIKEFQQRGGKRLFLETNRKLRPAIALYESVGFVPQPNNKPDSHYARSDLYMIWEPAPNLEQAASA